MQANIIKDLVDTTVKLVTSGSIAANAANYNYSNYSKQKKVIEDTYQSYIKQYPNRCLLLKMGYLEGVKSDLAKNFETIPLVVITSSIRHWLTNTRITRIEFENVLKL
jgi:hypothetical protein